MIVISTQACEDDFGKCTPGEGVMRACGESNIGECSYGTQIRVCKADSTGAGYWDYWSCCVGKIDPVAEICDGKDNDCDGETDEGGVCDKEKPKQYLEKPRPSYGLKLSQIVIVDEVIDPERQDLRIITNLYNNGDSDLKYTRVTAFIDGMNLRRSFGPFNLDKGDYYSDELFFDVPNDTAPGEYPIRLTFSNNNIKRVKYRFVTII